MWAGGEDVPLFSRTDDDSWPRSGRSESGITYTMDRDPEGDRWCAERHYLLDAFCCMPIGHDTPHLAVSAELVRLIGPLVVTSMRRVSRAVA